MDTGEEKDKVAEMARVFDVELRRTDPFGRNSLGEHAYRRAERVVAGMYLVTSHVPDSEPLKGEIRSLGANLLQAVLLLQPGFHSAGQERVTAVEAAIVHAASLIRVLTVSGYVSYENMETLVSGLDDLGGLCGAERRALSEHVNLTREHLLPRPRIPTLGKKAAVKDNSIHKGHTNGSKPDTSGKKDNQREESILSILGALGSCGIKDIVSRLPEYSEKMIQRTLADLVTRGVVSKSGELRWSKYSVAGASEK